eukprot:NODE_811_length_1848_cov_104.590936_g757_i0.p1 GENE.NODE_811_length_1848_cov_104.590936_g757_i0~~NODE_811_length_1848_cov_104.590936_g757_i0.p1  ORF type:complete len:584 (-),score=133.83 NODE_811_length_1848_cov_104.590936_g757_i0:47-1798(-)
MKWILAISLFALALGNDITHTYQLNERVKVWANKVGPLNNPLETYEYFSLPACDSDDYDHKFPSLGQALQGDNLIQHSKLKIRFQGNLEKTLVCSLSLTEEESDILRDAVLEQYWYQFYIDDLPIWGSLGKVVEKEGMLVPSIYLHQHFSLGYNGDRIVLANLTAEHEAPIPTTGVLNFTYSVQWTESKISYEQRFRRYLDNHFFEHKIHWFSIFNSFMMVIFLVGLVITILSRTLKADFQRYSRDKDEFEMETEFLEESGWKQVHGDVFRVPSYSCLFAALVATGLQLAVIVFVMILVSIVTMIYTSRGDLLTKCILTWAVSSSIAGYCSGCMHAWFAAVCPALQKHWIRTLVYTALLFPGVCVLSVFLMNFVAWGYHSSQAIPFGTMIVMLLIWGFIAFPMVVFGTVVGRARKAQLSNLPYVSHIPRMIPETKWYLQRPMFIVCGGILPFGTIFIELYFVFTSFWNYKFYYVYGFMLLVFCILVIVSMCVNIVCTYFQLSAEDHRWQWTSFWLSASTGAYNFLYACYFFFMKTKMSGLLMTTLYFGYMALFSFGIGIMAGSIGFAASWIFVSRIYRNVKLD